MKHFIIILLIIFGPKYGFLDLSFFTSLFVIILNINKLRGLNKMTFYFPLLTIVLIVCLTLFSNIFSLSDFDLSIILRYFRAFVGFVAAFVISLNLTRKKLINTIQLLLILNSILFFKISCLFRSILIFSNSMTLFKSFCFVLLTMFWILRISSLGSKGFGK